MHCFLIAAMSVDGFIAHEASEVSTKWTSREDAKWFGLKTKEAGVCVMGKTTYATVGRPLPGRLTIVLSKEGGPLDERRLKELRAGWDSWKGAQTPDGSASGEESTEWSAGIVLTTSDSPSTIKTKLDQAGFPMLAVCGGASIYTQFLQERLVDTLLLTVEPQIFGSGIKLITSASPDRILKLANVLRLTANTIVLEYSVFYPASEQ